MTSFVCNTTTLTFSRQPVYPFKKSIEKIQVSGRYSSNTPCSYNKSLRNDIVYTIQFEYMPEVEFVALKSFLNLVDGQLTLFTWNDDTSGINVPKTVRYNKDSLSWSYSSYNTIRSSLELKIV
jgi:hypothetical protein